MTRQLRVLVTPRDVGPYQGLLYRDLESAGVRVRYADGPTPSQTLNVFLSPAVLVWWRLRGYRVLHIHWTFHFSLPWAWPALWAARTMQFWFVLYLRIAQLSGYSIVWTAHDLLPHHKVFADDVKARAFLLSKAKVVIALSEATAAVLRGLGARNVVVIPIGPYSMPYEVVLTEEEARASFGFRKDDVVISLIGRMEKYKGVDLLLQAAMKLPAASKIAILLAGQFTDKIYMGEIELLIEQMHRKIVTHFEWISDDDLARYMQATDFAVYPFRAISNSGSALLAQSFGRPIVIPDTPLLSDIPDGSAIRYEQGLDELVDALLRAERLTETEYIAMSEAALAWSRKTSWESIARETVTAYAIGLRE